MPDALSPERIEDIFKKTTKKIPQEEKGHESQQSGDTALPTTRSNLQMVWGWLWGVGTDLRGFDTLENGRGRINEKWARLERNHEGEDRSAKSKTVLVNGSQGNATKTYSNTIDRRDSRDYLER